MEGKRDRALSLGADAALPADAGDLVERAHTALGGPVDVVFGCMARERSWPRPSSWFAASVDPQQVKVLVTVESP
ncbi:hypothetical protein [Streptomyces shaanxiensis]|uniref:Uncharacterized protein n=1 Tax=Streptomyces shaanxiensis TaxID=653357 RepID=A0ABP7UY88_9ACTN